MALPLTALATLRPPKQVKAPLVRIKTVFTQGETPEVVEVEANLDPLEILKAAGVGILVGGVALAAGWLLWDGLAAPTPLGPIQIFRGMKESPFWEDEARRARARLDRKRIGDQQDEQDQLRADLEADDDACKLLYKDFQRAARRGDFDAENEAIRKAKELGCMWSKSL